MEGHDRRARADRRRETKRAPHRPRAGAGARVAKTADPGCFHVSWVEGSDTSTRTKLARACNGVLVPPSLTRLSSDGVEGGRAYLATDPTSPTALFAVWQELPAGKPAELHVAKLTCASTP